MLKISKWTTINHEMREQRIGILCVQETHLCPEHLSQIDNFDPIRPGSSAGIAFILNKEIINTDSAKIQVLIPGRAALLTINWHNNNIIKILNIYAPNNLHDHKNFWEKIKTEWHRLSLGAPDFMVGDFNLTEDPIDRAPARLDNEAAIEALRDLRTMLQVQDMWRVEHPHRQMFTFSSNHQTLSRLDRIYASERHATSLIDWDSHICRWAWPQGLISNTDLINKVIKLGINVQTNIENHTPCSDEANPQTLWCTFKNDLNKLARDTAKHHLHRINQRICSLTKDMRKLANDKNIDNLEDTRENITPCTSEMGNTR
ncbi:Endonuclease/exonuclease/phosphatase [Suillus occidentalis]|nr:Endonuclease/exonuclease/phosphatase [Suillus occidentalis]